MPHRSIAVLLAAVCNLLSADTSRPHFDRRHMMYDPQLVIRQAISLLRHRFILHSPSAIPRPIITAMPWPRARSGYQQIRQAAVWPTELTEPCFVLILIYLLTAIGLSLGGSSTVHIYTQIIQRTTQQLWLEGFLGFEPTVIKLKLTMYLHLGVVEGLVSSSNPES